MPAKQGYIVQCDLCGREQIYDNRTEGIRAACHLSMPGPVSQPDMGEDVVVCLGCVVRIEEWLKTNPSAKKAVQTN